MEGLFPSASTSFGRTVRPGQACNCFQASLCVPVSAVPFHPLDEVLGLGEPLPTPAVRKVASHSKLELAREVAKPNLEVVVILRGKGDALPRGALQAPRDWYLQLAKHGDGLLAVESRSHPHKGPSNDVKGRIVLARDVVSDAYALGLAGRAVKGIQATDDMRSYSWRHPVVRTIPELLKPLFGSLRRLSAGCHGFSHAAPSPLRLSAR